MELRTAIFLMACMQIADSTCIFPESIWSKVLYMKNDNTTLTKISFDNSTLNTVNFSWGVYTVFSCFMTYDSIYMLRSSGHDLMYVCMKISTINHDVHYIHLLTDQILSPNRKKIPDVSSKKDDKSFTCTYCNYSSPYTTFLLIHDVNITTHEMKSPPFCDPCSRRCGGASNALKRGKRQPQTFIVGIVIATFCIGGFLIGLCLYVAQQRKKKREAEAPEEEELKRIDSEQAGPIEDFKDIPSGEIQEDRVDLS